MARPRFHEPATRSTDKPEQAVPFDHPDRLIDGHELGQWLGLKSRSSVHAFLDSGQVRVKKIKLTGSERSARRVRLGDLFDFMRSA